MRCPRPSRPWDVLPLPTWICGTGDAEGGMDDLLLDLACAASDANGEGPATQKHDWLHGAQRPRRAGVVGLWAQVKETKTGGASHGNLPFPSRARACWHKHLYMVNSSPSLRAAWQGPSHRRHGLPKCSACTPWHTHKTPESSKTQTDWPTQPTWPATSLRFWKRLANAPAPSSSSPRSRSRSRSWSRLSLRPLRSPRPPPAIFAAVPVEAPQALACQRSKGSGAVRQIICIITVTIISWSLIHQGPLRSSPCPSRPPKCLPGRRARVQRLGAVKHIIVIIAAWRVWLHSNSCFKIEQLRICQHAQGLQACTHSPCKSAHTLLPLSLDHANNHAACSCACWTLPGLSLAVTFQLLHSPNWARRWRTCKVQLIASRSLWRISDSSTRLDEGWVGSLPAMRLCTAEAAAAAAALVTLGLAKKLGAAIWAATWAENPAWLGGPLRPMPASCCSTAAACMHRPGCQDRAGLGSAAACTESWLPSFKWCWGCSGPRMPWEQPLYAGACSLGIL